jgi:hypothetical protein
VSRLGVPLILMLVLGVLAAGAVGARRRGVRMRLVRDEERRKTGAR